MPIVCRRIGHAGAALLTRIAPDVFDNRIDPARLSNYLLSPGHLMVLAFDGDLIVGQCTGVVHHRPEKDSELYVDEVGTASTHRRQGIATDMLKALFAWARELGCHEAWLGTELDNMAANGLFRRLGARDETIRFYEFALHQ